MLNDITFLPTRIATGQPMRIVDGTGTEICNVEGAVWITQAGDPRDIVLAAGERFRLDRGGLT